MSVWETGNRPRGAIVAISTEAQRKGAAARSEPAFGAVLSRHGFDPSAHWAEAYLDWQRS